MSLEIGGAAYQREHLKKAAPGVQFSIFASDLMPNAWLLRYKCSAHILVVMQKSMEKLC